MSNRGQKVDPKTLERLKYLLSQGLTQAVIATRLGISTRTVRIYVRSLKTGSKPYKKHVPSEDYPEETRQSDDCPASDD